MADPVVTRAQARAQGLPRYFTGKPCKRGHVAERYTRNLTCVDCDLAKTRERQWHKANPEKHRERNRRWDAENREKRAAYRQANREKWLEYFRARWHAIPPEDRHARKREWYESNREHAVRYTAEWAQNNPDRAKLTKEVVSHRRRARIAEANGTHTAADLKALLAAQGHRCAYCRADLRKVKRHLDHVMPLARGGSNGCENLQYLCAPCNLAKGAKDPVDFARERGTLI